LIFVLVVVLVLVLVIENAVFEDDKKRIEDDDVNMTGCVLIFAIKE
jgi:hypothetical protein